MQFCRPTVSMQHTVPQRLGPISRPALSGMGELPSRCCKNIVAFCCSGMPREDKILC